MTKRILLAVILFVPLSLSALTPRSMSSEAAAAIVEAMNRERAAQGLPPLQLNEQLCEAASDRVQDMFTQHYFAHNAPDGTSPFVCVDRHGYPYKHAGENLAVGYRGTDVVDGWMHSPGHRANVLGADYQDVGIAIADDSPATPFHGPLVVAIYGSR